MQVFLPRTSGDDLLLPIGRQLRILLDSFALSLDFADLYFLLGCASADALGDQLKFAIQTQISDDAAFSLS